jgi:hypothetical protein
MTANKRLVNREFTRFAEQLRQYSGAFEDSFWCPICDRAFPRNALEFDLLSAAHIVPAYLGGTRRTVLCKDCNSVSGFKTEGKLARIHRKFKPLFDGTEANQWNRLQIISEGELIQVKAKLRSLQMYGVNVLEAVLLTHLGTKESAEAAHRFLEKLTKDKRKFDLLFEEPEIDLNALRVQEYTIAFLAMFSVLGYEFVLSASGQWMKKMIKSGIVGDEIVCEITSKEDLKPGTIFVVNTDPISFVVAMPNVHLHPRNRMVWIPPLIIPQDSFDYSRTQLATSKSIGVLNSNLRFAENDHSSFLKRLYGCELTVHTA